MAVAPAARTKARIGYGTQFYMQATASAVALTKAAEVTSVSLPNVQTADVEATHYESPDRTREYIAGMKDPGELTMEINWVPGEETDTMLAAAQSSGDVLTMRTVVPGAQQFTYPGIVRGFERTAPMDDKLTATVTIRVAGAVVQAKVSADPTVIA